MTIKGTANGVSATDAITLYPATASAAALTVSKVSCGTQTLTGPTTEACTVYVDAAPTSPTSVTLSSSNSALTVPTSVTVAAGATSASFSAQAAAVTTTATVTLTAAANGTSATDVLQLTGTSSSQSSTQHQVDLSWDAPTATSDPVVGYHVYRAASNSTSYTLLTSSVDAQTSYTDTSVVSGTSYAYQVKSVDSKGVESAPSNTTSVTVP
ncbi:MAG: fibronectin type III domain-containing protein [Terracidiphilus sp.]